MSGCTNCLCLQHRTPQSECMNSNHILLSAFMPGENITMSSFQTGMQQKSNMSGNHRTAYPFTANRVPSIINTPPSTVPKRGIISIPHTEPWWLWGCLMWTGYRIIRKIMIHDRPPTWCKSTFNSFICTRSVTCTGATCTVQLAPCNLHPWSFGVISICTMF